MGKIVFYKEYRNSDQFRIDYPYYGLFGTANVTRLIMGSDVIFKCALLNGSIIIVKKTSEPQKWIDTELNVDTPLSTTIGHAIDDFLKNQIKE